jgi:HK97 family phage portal protein
MFGFNIQVSRATTPQPTTPLYGDRGNWWFPIIREPMTGAWQKNIELRTESVVTYFAVYACLSLISTDIGKLRLRLMRRNDAGISIEAQSAAFSPVLRKPNHYQIRGKFIESWMLSKLIHGNTYVLKERDARGVVVRLYVLDPVRAKVLVAPDGSIAYEFAADNLSGFREPIVIPASEIIHDVNTWLFHPLCGISPILAASLPVLQGLNIQQHSAKFFAAGARPGGILTAPGPVPKQRLQEIKDDWETNFSGENAGRVAVLGDGLKYETMGFPAEESQLIEQLKWSAENVCSVFHVPPFMIGIGTSPSFDNVEALNQQYYSQCLQAHIEAIEALLDDGLGLPATAEKYETEFDLDDLLRMDTKTKVTTTSESIKAGFLAPNEARARFNLLPVKGGEMPIVQQQNWPLDVLAERPPPQETGAVAAPAPPADDEGADNDDEGDIDVERILTLARLN